MTGDCKQIGPGRRRVRCVCTKGKAEGAKQWAEGQVAFAVTGTDTYRTANFRGLSVSTGKRKKQIMKQTVAPRLQAPKMSIRSHRLTSDKICEHAFLDQMRNIKMREEVTGEEEQSNLIGCQNGVV